MASFAGKITDMKIYSARHGAAWILGAASIGIAGCGGGGGTPTIPTAGITVPAPVAGQSELLFAATRASENASRRRGLFFADLSSSKVFNVPIAGFQGAQEQAWLPGRQELLYLGFAPTQGASGRSAATSPLPPSIRRVKRDGTGDRALAGTSAASGLSVSPDGRRVAYSARFITVSDVDGTNARTLSEGRDPAWSPDGTRLIYSVFSSDGNSNAQSLLHVMGADGSNPTRIASSTGFDAEPDWSPDGRRIVFHSIFRSGASQTSEIFSMNADGSGRTRLTRNESFDTRPKWTPDGRRIVFLSYSQGVTATGGTLQVMNADGSNQVQLRADPLFDFDLR